MTEDDLELPNTEPGYHEEAAVPYQPDADGNGPLAAARERFEALVLGRDGVLGVGMGQSPTGDDALTVYLRDPGDAASLPSVFEDFVVTFETVGEIDAY